jgi:hypothetical protein
MKYSYAPLQQRRYPHTSPATIKDRLRETSDKSKALAIMKPMTGAMIAFGKARSILCRSQDGTGRRTVGDFGRRETPGLLRREDQRFGPPMASCL